MGSFADLSNESKRRPTFCRWGSFGTISEEKICPHVGLETATSSSKEDGVVGERSSGVV